MASVRRLDMVLRRGGGGAEKHAQPTLLSNFILGAQDGLVNVLGIILGVSTATADVRLIYVAALAALAAESISMAAVAYTSTVARMRHYLREVEREKGEMRAMPDVERGRVRAIFRKWGYSGRALEDVTDRIVSNRRALLEFMMAHELDLEPVERREPLRSFAIVGLATVFGSFFPLIPFIIAGGNIAAGVAGSVAFSALLLFAIGAYEAKTTVGSLWRSGLQLLVIGLVAGLAGYAIGRIFGAVPV